MLNQRGFSLTELLIGSAVGLLVIAGAVQLYLLNLRVTGDNLRISRLNQELRATLDLLRNDLRRAGYWALEPGSGDPADNPFQTAGNRVHFGQVSGEADDSCILYSYDLNSDRLVGVGEAGNPGPATTGVNLEQFGFRLREGVVQMRNGGDSFDCTSGSWQAITDPDTEIIILQFTLTETCSNLIDSMQACSSAEPALLHRHIAIAIEGRSRSDTSVTQQLTSTVAIANDILLAAYP